jgi:hypothetical protein
MLYMDNGPIAKSRVFENVMDCLGVKVATKKFTSNWLARNV